MKTAIICFSLTGWETGRRLKEGLESGKNTVTLEGKSRYLPESIEESTGQWAGKRFSDSDAIIFVGACGIAVRSIAPYIQKKTKDPAVLVIDECGKFVISLLSGHLGGANALTLKAAEILKAEPVVTTATDLHNRFAVDVFAKKNGCAILNMKAAKEVSAALLAGKTVGFFSDFPWEGELPKGLVLCEGTEENLPETGVSVSVYKSRKPFKETVSIVPPAVVLGMGCRKGKDTESVRKAAEKALKEAGVKVIRTNKIEQDSPNLMDLILGHKIDLVIDTPSQGVEHSKDGFLIRRNAIETGVNVLTAMDTAKALVTSLENTDLNQLTLIDIAKI